MLLPIVAFPALLRLIFFIGIRYVRRPYLKLRDEELGPAEHPADCNGDKKSGLRRHHLHQLQDQPVQRHGTQDGAPRHRLLCCLYRVLPDQVVRAAGGAVGGVASDGSCKASCGL